MTRDDISLAVTRIISEILSVDSASISGGTLLVEDLGCDSVHAVEILYSLQDFFKIKIPQTAMAKVSTVDDIVGYIVKRTGGK